VELRPQPEWRLVAASLHVLHHQWIHQGRRQHRRLQLRGRWLGPGQRQHLSRHRPFSGQRIRRRAIRPGHRVRGDRQQLVVLGPKQPPAGWANGSATTRRGCSSVPPAKACSPRWAPEAEWVSFWGEVYSNLANPNNTTTQMGSGHQSGRQAGRRRGFQRIFTSSCSPMPISSTNRAFPAAEDPAKFDIKSFMNSGGSWGSLLLRRRMIETVAIALTLAGAKGQRLKRAT